MKFGAPGIISWVPLKKMGVGLRVYSFSVVVLGRWLVILFRRQNLFVSSSRQQKCHTGSEPLKSPVSQNIYHEAACPAWLGNDRELLNSGAFLCFKPTGTDETNWTTQQPHTEVQTSTQSTLLYKMIKRNLSQSCFYIFTP